jgi:hypothetical protein
LFATIRRESDATIVGKLFEAWQPTTAVLALPSCLTRSQFYAFSKFGGKDANTPSKSKEYSRFYTSISHKEVGGVTSSRWSIVVLLRHHRISSKKSLMTTTDYPICLQTALDDTKGSRYGRTPKFEARPEGSELPPLAIGIVKLAGKTCPVYDGRGLAPDLGLLDWDVRQLWVRAASVFSRKKPVIRQVNNQELFSIWDYEGKLQPMGWSHSQLLWVMAARFVSPPAKIVRSILFNLCSNKQLNATPVAFSEAGATPLQSAKVPYSPLELQVDTRVKAAQPEDAEVDLSSWALPNETEEIARARQVLRRFAVKWWQHYQEKVARSWLAEKERTPEDVEAVEDCVRRVKATTYFTWPHGSRHLFYKVKDPNWRKDFRDGVQFWRTSKPPSGKMKNAKSPSREEELLARQKVFKLLFNWYMKKSPARLMTPRFLVPKLVEDGIVLDVRCVWDCKVNGLNLALWAPGFMLPDSQDGEDMVVKWLTMSVAQYLQAGSPDMDYTQDTRKFIKSEQGDIDVGQHFNNYRAHKTDQPYLGIRYIHTNNAKGAVELETNYCSTVLPFGCTCSPYIACQGQARITEIAKGDTTDPNNPFHFDRVVLNLQAASNYDP